MYIVHCIRTLTLIYYLTYVLNEQKNGATQNMCHRTRRAFNNNIITSGLLLPTKEYHMPKNIYRIDSTNSVFIRGEW